MSRRKTFYRIKFSIEEPPINLTPLIDVVFVILIMFILVAPLLELDQVQLAEAMHGGSEKMINVQESGPISIHVRKDNTLLFNNRLTMMEELPKLMLQAKNQYPEAKPQLFHDKQGHFGTYQKIKNAAELAGFKQMDVILSP